MPSYRLILTSLFLFLFAAATASASLPQSLEPLPEHTETTRNIVDALASRHYVDAKINDELSGKVLDAYIKDLDPAKSYFLQQDINEFETYRNLLDNALLSGDPKPAFSIYNRFHERVVDRHEKILTMLDAGLDQFDFDKEEILVLDRKDAAWAADMDELDGLWRKRVKNSILNLKLTEKADDKIMELIRKRYKNRLDRTLQTNGEDIFQLFMNSFTGTYDPHTQYFSPQTSENFNINMSLSLEGIGAVLQREDEYTKVVSLVPAGPADKSEALHPDDKIVSVGQGRDGELVDVIGWRLDEVVQLIRGKTNSIVRLEIIPKGSKDESTQLIEITRNKVKLEEQSAKSEVIEIEQFGHIHKIGVIAIPTFYIDFQALQKGEKDYKSTTRDVRDLIRNLRNEGIEGLIVDLRDNGGGSLQEANFLTGLFINRGPTVQIRSKSDRVDVLKDIDPRTVYDGPLVVLVNRLSASASEIFAGAIQDYQRGVVVGSQTFGKGTVQALIPLNRGQLKLTQAKFYRISGESTQHQGILPDIHFPDRYDIDSIGESTLDMPLAWDKITATPYRPASNLGSLLDDLLAQHQGRVTNDPEFSYLQKAHDFRVVLAKETSISLSRKARDDYKKWVDNQWLALENEKRVAQGLDMVTSLDELNTDPHATLAEGGSTGYTGSADLESDENESELQGNRVSIVPKDPPNPAGITAPEPASEPLELDEPNAVVADAEPKEPDAYLVESGHILLDLIELSSRTADKTQHAPI